MLSPNGYLHAATVVGLADTRCGLGCRVCPPDGLEGFTTPELTSSFLASRRSGTMSAETVLVNGGGERERL